jgi:hypothetical protein
VLNKSRGTVIVLQRTSHTNMYQSVKTLDKYSLMYVDNAKHINVYIHMISNHDAKQSPSIPLMDRVCQTTAYLRYMAQEG